MAGNPNIKPRFVKGQSGNPSGKRALPEHLKKIHKLSRDEVNAIFSKYCRMSKDEMLEATKNGTLPALELWVCSGIVNGIKNGDWYNMNIMFDRIFGRPETISETQILPESHNPVTVTLPSNGKEVITIE